MKECSGKAETAKPNEPIVGEVYETTYGQLFMCVEADNWKFAALTHNASMPSGYIAHLPGTWEEGRLIHKPNACICKDGCGK